MQTAHTVGQLVLTDEELCISEQKLAE